MGGAASVSLMQATEKLLVATLGGGVYHTRLVESACSAAADMQGRRCVGGSGIAGTTPRVGQLLSWAGRDGAAR